MTLMVAVGTPERHVGATARGLHEPDAPPAATVILAGRFSQFLDLAFSQSDHYSDAIPRPAHRRRTPLSPARCGPHGAP